METSSRILKAILAMALLSIVSISVYADLQMNLDNLGRQFVKDSYIVTFKEPTEGSLPIVDPPNQEIIDKAKRGEIEIPFGESSTMQSKQEIAEKIGLNGEVISIFETINAIHVKMDAQEAQRLSLDERVLYVEPDMIMTANSGTPNIVLLTTIQLFRMAY
ncbi:secreted protein [Beggiatoa sp. PS]|nr:secreted protein [Beggiatoa sp. PS]